MKINRDLVIIEFKKALTTESFYEALGFAWGIGSKAGDKFIIRHQNKEFVKQAADNIPFSAFFYLNAKSRDQYVCQFGLQHPMFQYMLQLGWKGRLYEERPFPRGPINELAFIKGFAKAHYTYDSIKIKNITSPRIRIYGGKNVLEQINQVFNKKFGTTLKAVQKHGKSSVCHILYYSSKKEVPILLDFLKK